MGCFTKTHHPSYEDDDFMQMLRKSRKAKPKDHNGGFSEDYFHNRFYMPSYIKQLKAFKSTKITQEAVYARISQGVGKNALSNLLQYVTHSSREQIEKGAQYSNLYDHNGQALSDEQIKALKLEWSEDFASKSFQNSYPERSNTLIMFHNRSQELRIKESAGDITEVERDALSRMRQRGVEKAIWEIGTTVALEDSQKALIHDIDAETNDVIVVLSDRENANPQYKTYNKDDICPSLTKEGFKINQAGAPAGGNVNLALDDTNYQVETLSFKEARRALPKDFEHFILSVGGDHPDQKKSFEATQRFLKDNLYKRGFRYVFAEHQDSDHLHYHVIAHRTNILDHSRKFPTSLHDSFIFRKEYCESLCEMGIDRTITLNRDRSNILEQQREKAEKALKRSRRFKSQKRNPEAGNLFANYYSLNEYLDSVEKKMDDFDIDKKKKKEVQDILDRSRYSIKLDDEETFKNAASGFSQSLRDQSDQMAEFWDEVMIAEKLKNFDQDYTIAKRKNNAIDAQAKQTEKLLESYVGLKLVQDEVKNFPDKKTMAEEINKLLNDTSKMIIESDQYRAMAEGLEPKFKNRNDIIKYLDKEKLIEKEEAKTQSKSSRMRM